MDDNRPEPIVWDGRLYYPSDSFATDHIMTDAERAVIEAAKKWWDDDDESPKYAQLLGLAIEQLRAAEGEE